MYVLQSYAEAFSLGLKGHVYYAMIEEVWYHVGLLYPDLTPKPAYQA
jgi:hypothetical protein